MTEHWNEHSLDFSRPDFQKAEGEWKDNYTGFTIDTEQELTEQDMIDRRKVYEETDPDVPNLQKRQMYTNQVRADPSYRFLMMVAAFSKNKLGTVMNVTQNPNITTTTRTKFTNQIQINQNTQQNRTVEIEENPKGICTDSDEIDGVCALGENSGKLEGKSWVTMPEISGSIQLTPEVYGHIKEAQMIVEGFSNRPISLKVFIEDTRYQTLFARLVAIRMGLTSYFDSSDKQKDRIFIRLHQEQTMLLRRIRTVKGKQKQDYSNPHGY